MPLHIIPRRIFAHRIACKALYRACLTQFPRIPAPDDVSSQGAVPLLKHLIRKGFKKNIHVTSSRLAVQELKRGYAAEELLRNAGNGNKVAIAQVHEILRQTARSRDLSRLASPRRPRSAPTHNSTIPAPFPGAPKVLDTRPLPKEQLSGRRKVPTLTAANWLPFLRFKRPQSRYLGRVLRDKLEQKIRRWGAVEECDAMMEVGESEGVWEGKIARQVRKELALAGEGRLEAGEERVREMRQWLEDGEGREYGGSKERFYAKTGGEGGKERRSMWAAEAARQKWALWEKVSRENKLSLERGKKMLEIVERERELWLQESRRQWGISRLLGRRVQRGGRCPYQKCSIRTQGPFQISGLAKGNPLQAVAWNGHSGNLRAPIPSRRQKRISWRRS
ncbi:uncharacterized protein K444DRAFT_304788 [Hyaloscypha bicolor E]|uniref:Uncharacterized protein n=1 Tax=Hyaloscypha bicolor E TaxID=1095630 RepID=A0A2J6TMW3_9HELO|nr:uncharacterized protein K444DRAFT_304788 [Hyaloscypha bicolor E]PMD64374.1 hypothetical protein K444DRAFT_304788 [Hyaloscypha bicolor E]